jgi:hypothetical protein
MTVMDKGRQENRPLVSDSGLNGYASAGQFYGMELEVLEGYENLVPMY